MNMVTTFDLLKKYCAETFGNDENKEGDILRNYEINGSIIKLFAARNYGKLFKTDKEDFYQDKTHEVELLDYITWVFNQTKV